MPIRSLNLDPCLLSILIVAFWFVCGTKILHQCSLQRKCQLNTLANHVGKSSTVGNLLLERFPQQNLNQTVSEEALRNVSPLGTEKVS